VAKLGVQAGSVEENLQYHFSIRPNSPRVPSALAKSRTREGRTCWGIVHLLYRQPHQLQFALLNLRGLC